MSIPQENTDLSALSLNQYEPSPSAVQTAIKSLQPSLPLTTLHKHLRTLTQRLHVAVPKTSAFPQLHTSLHHTTIAATQLVERTLRALHTFRHAAGKALDDVHLALDLLHDNLPAPAEDMLRATRNHNASLADTSSSLAGEFSDAADTLSDALALAIVTQATQREKASIAKANSDESYVRLSNIRHTHIAASQAEQAAKALYESAERKESAARMRGNMVHAAHAATILGSLVTTRGAPLMLGMSAAAIAQSLDTQAHRAREERAVHLRHRHDARDKRDVSAREMADVEERLRCARRDELLEQSVLEALEDSVEALRMLAGVMVSVEEFWRAVGGGVRGRLTLGGADMCVSERFRVRVLDVIAFWKAVAAVCDAAAGGVGAVADGVSMAERLSDVDSETVRLLEDGDAG